MEEKKIGISEDWLAVWIGLFIFILSLGTFAGMDVLGWGVTTGVWTDLSKALKPMSAAYAGLGGVGSLLATYVVLLAIMTVGALALKADIKKFIVSFTVVFWISYICWIIGSWAHIAVTTAPDLQKFGITWSLKLTPEAGFIIALAVGLIFGNFFPSFAAAINEAVRPEWYIKTAIVILGGFLGVTAAEKLGLASAVMFRGLCAIVEAYLIYWAVVYFIARKYFKFSREWAAPLASGISICGVSAAIATGGAIKARPMIPIMVSSLVVIFAVVELVVLPFVAETFLYKEPMVAGAWMGLAVKTDGAAVAAGAVADSLIRAKALAVDGVNYKEGWIMGAAATVKVFIDVFIGVWAFILAIIWCSVIECKPGEKVRPGQIWDRFPKFVIGYVVTFAIILWICIPASKSVTALGDQIGPLTKQIAVEETQMAALAAVKETRQGGHCLSDRPDRQGQVTACRPHRSAERPERDHGSRESFYRGGQYLQGDLLHHDLLHDRPGVQLQEALGRGHRQARGGLRDLAFRVHHLGRLDHLMDLLPRRKTAVGRLNRERG